MSSISLNIAEQVNVIIARNEGVYKLRCERIEAAYKEANSNIPPNVDKYQRCHAPCHGYVIPKVKLDFCDFNDCYENRLFSQGEFLPNPVSNDEFSWLSRRSTSLLSKLAKIKISGDDFDVIKEIDSDGMPFKFSCGKTWEKDGVNHAYLYVYSCWKSVLDVFRTEFTKPEPKKVEKPQKGDAITGEKITVSCKILNMSYKDNGYGSSVLKMFVEFENGSTAYGSVPKAIVDAEKGDTVEFVASFSLARGSKDHAFFKSPSKAKILILA